MKASHVTSKIVSKIGVWNLGAILFACIVAALLLWAALLQSVESFRMRTATDQILEARAYVSGKRIEAPVADILIETDEFLVTVLEPRGDSKAYVLFYQKDTGNFRLYLGDRYRGHRSLVEERE